MSQIIGIGIGIIFQDIVNFVARSLKLNDTRNSQYLTLISIGGM